VTGKKEPTFSHVMPSSGTAYMDPMLTLDLLYNMAVPSITLHDAKDLSRSNKLVRLNID
jgi:hypothetical protein